MQFEFDQATGVFENGSFLFKKSFVTYTVGKASKRFRLSGNFDIADIDGMTVEISSKLEVEFSDIRRSELKNELQQF